ncbi:ABC transporter permease [Sphaerisporangium siamense]|uniref:Putative ABC transport system permease protein n=1 Tax=Sphaerisporangium siamense TaxID=795645 RepID=A0A7W7D1W9_9ACTN|nr:ABC transporter permease [Sphaerisporangium siamense]MBB4698789.1 putative ABC transport system permease protein [Sphaerisporangium siamense]GII89127.1 ABC transporter permease [Sphaerisporangium siamense]
MWALALSTLRHRASAFAAAFVAMLLGAAIVSACGGLMETGIRLAVPPQRLAGAAVVVTGDQSYALPKADPKDEEEDVQYGLLPERVPLDPRLAGGLARLPGVAAAVPHTSSTGAVQAVAVTAKDGTDARELAGQVERAVGGSAVVLTGDERGLAEFPQALPARENLVVLAAVFGAMAIIVSMFVVAATLALSVRQRQREMALMRAIGATPGQVRRMVVAETMALSIAATLPGGLLGPVLGGWLFDRLVDNAVVPGVVAYGQGWLPAAVGVAVSLLSALVAALVTARRAAAARPAEALAEAAAPPVRTGAVRRAAAAVCFAGGVALALVTVLFMHGPLVSSTAGPAVLLWAIGLALAAPALVKGVTSVLARPVLALSGPAGHLAVLNTRAGTARLAAAVVPVLLATGMATANLYMQTTQTAAATSAYAGSLRADLVVTPAAPGVLDRVRAVEGVAAASEYVTSTGYVDAPHDFWQREEGWPLRGVTAEGAEGTLATTVTAGDLRRLKGDTVALTAEHARNIGGGVGVGDTVTMRLGDRAQVRLRVVALLKVETGNEMALLPASALAPHTTAGAPSEILVRTAHGADATAGALRGLGLEVRGRDALTAAFGAARNTQAWVNYLLVGVIVAYTAIAVVNTQVMATARRRREFGLQRLTGSTRGQVMRMTGVEALMVAITGVLLGTVASAISLVPFAIAVDGSPLPSGPWWIYAGVVGACALITVGATWLPTWLVTRSRPAEAAAALT